MKVKYSCSESFQIPLFDNGKYYYPESYKKIRSSQGNSLETFQLNNRRYLGNKYKLLNFIKDIVNEKAVKFKSFCDIFAGTGVVGEAFNSKGVKVISNDILNCNYVSLRAFLGIKNIDYSKLKEKIDYLNNLSADVDNYFSHNFAQTYFTLKNAKKIRAK